MGRTSIVMIVFTLPILFSLVSTSSQSQQPGRQTTRLPNSSLAQLQMEKTVTTQQRINRYFHGEVMPKLKDCWNRIQGRGVIEIEHTYIRDGSGMWTADKLTATKTTLRKDQEEMALQCMQNSVRGTAFPLDSADGDAINYVVNWTWPVPFPRNAASLTGRMFAAKPTGGTSKLGCDGEGTPAKCFSCSRGSCVKVCVGYKRCVVINSGGSGTACSSHDACASGGPFGVSSGAIIF